MKYIPSITNFVQTMVVIWVVGNVSALRGIMLPALPRF